MSNYNIAFSAIEIRNTRSGGEDTLWIRFNMSVDGRPLPAVEWDGSHCNGQSHSGRNFNSGLCDGFRNQHGKLVGNEVSLVDTSIVRITYLVVNQRNSPTADFWSGAFADIADVASVAGGVWGAIVGGLAGGLSAGLKASCDGAVAAYSFQRTGKEIRKSIPLKPPYYNWTSPQHKGSTHPLQCRESNYQCFIQFTHA